MAFMTFFHVRTCRAAAFAALVLVFPLPALAAEQGGDWLNSVGGFLLDGLGPARTLEDVRREEERAREAERNARLRPVAPVETAPVEMAKPAPVELAPVIAAPQPLPAPDLMPAPVPAPPVAHVPAPAPVPVVKAATVVASPPPLPPSVPEARPKPSAAARAPEPPQGSLSTRIAATATLDQAIRLGGPAEVYGAKAKGMPAAP